MLAHAYTKLALAEISIFCMRTKKNTFFQKMQIFRTKSPKIAIFCIEKQDFFLEKHAFCEKLSECKTKFLLPSATVKPLSSASAAQKVILNGVRHVNCSVTYNINKLGGRCMYTTRHKQSLLCTTQSSCCILYCCHVHVQHKTLEQ